MAPAIRSRPAIPGCRLGAGGPAIPQIGQGNAPRGGMAPRGNFWRARLAAFFPTPLISTSGKALPLAQTYPEAKPMLTLHHLNDSRSQRIMWLLEELAVPYEMKFYQRDAKTRLAPPELVAIHPLGKSPVITDRDLKIAESGAIVDYLIRTYGNGKMMPATGT